MITSQDVLTLAQTIYGEARNEPATAKVAVGMVIRNRVDASYEPYGVVCRKPYEFACWTVGNENRARIQTPDFSDLVWLECLRIAVDIIEEVLADSTGGALYYHSSRGDPPAWSLEQTPCYRAGHLVFYKTMAPVLPVPESDSLTQGG